ncbi:MAG: 2-C-methyl-D-erythritol 4-phosphate cytidylyltransferase [Clostridia bacterium]|nr:2-C-methyl-D-erythritol 4-phosphate cytidylyltransferase [Clostridia bacterium]
MRTDTSHPYTVAIILAAGCGSRFSREKTKQKFEILGKSVLERCLLQFDLAECVDEIVVVHKEDEYDFVCGILKKISKKCTAVIGGKTRAESSRRGFLSVGDGCEAVLIHDAARCLILPSDIDKIAKETYRCGAACAACEITDTVKRLSEGAIVSTLDRTGLVTVQTPQGFSYSLYRDALAACDDGSEITDDNMRLERMGVPITPVYVTNGNIKLTREQDLLFAEFILKQRGEG